MWQALAAEGVWVEPASAAGLAGLAKEIRGGRLQPAGKRIVGVCTGHGLKDPEIIASRMLPATLELMDETAIACIEEARHLGLPLDVEGEGVLAALDGTHHAPSRVGRAFPRVPVPASPRLPSHLTVFS